MDKVIEFKRKLADLLEEYGAEIWAHADYIGGTELTVEFDDWNMPDYEVFGYIDPKLLRKV